LFVTLRILKNGKNFPKYIDGLKTLNRPELASVEVIPLAYEVEGLESESQ
jgi:hypothetical protein